jgi:hypothetical protein
MAVILATPKVESEARWGKKLTRLHLSNQAGHAVIPATRRQR